MKIAIDCRSFRKKPAGVPNFLISLVNSLSDHRKDWTIYLLTNEDFHEQAEARIRYSSNLVKVITPLWFLPHIATIWYLFKVPFLIRPMGIDVFYSPIPNLPLWMSSKVRTMVSVHDMVFKDFPETMSRGNRLINLLLHDRSINRADNIWAVSNFTKREIELTFPDRFCKNIFVGSSVDKLIFQHRVISSSEKNRVLTRYGLTERFILFVGTLEPRKNLQFLISLIPELAKCGYSLLIVGAQGWGKETNPNSTISKELQHAVKFSGFISTQELVTLYNSADVYVSTSLNEGFGLPQLEAMCCGCPVVSPHNSAMIEIVEGAGETVKGWDKKEWVDTILKVSSNRQYYISRGFQRAEAYDWNRVIEGLVHYIAAT